MDCVLQGPSVWKEQGGGGGGGREGGILCCWYLTFRATLLDLGFTDGLDLATAHTMSVKEVGGGEEQRRSI